MASGTTGQSVPDDPHRPEGPRMPPPAYSVEYRKCLRCSKTKPLQNFKSMRKEGSYVAGLSSRKAFLQYPARRGALMRLICLKNNAYQLDN
ncbi:hypothetical protein E4U31_005024, partial [Claviceps sp. LM219 group G6]